jgi:hypothetical protein
MNAAASVRDPTANTAAPAVVDKVLINLQQGGKRSWIASRKRGGFFALCMSNFLMSFVR